MSKNEKIVLIVVGVIVAIFVVAIMGIIALISIPNLSGIRQRSQVSADIRTAENIGKATRIWVTDIEADELRRLPTSPVKYDSAKAKGEELYKLPHEYIMAGLEAKSLKSGSGYYYVSSFEVEGADSAQEERKIKVAIAGSDKEALKLQGKEDKYDGTSAGWAYIEQ